MTDKIDDGGLAFPLPGLALPDGRGYPVQRGMSLRDWFAGQALAGCCADPNIRNGVNATPEEFWRIVADDYYMAADAMLAARAKGGEK